MLQARTIGFLGAGSIAEALIHGLVAGGDVAPAQLLVTNRSNRERLAFLAERYGVRTTSDRAAVAAEADILVVACKPKDVAGLLQEVGPSTRAGQVLISLAAGISTQSMLPLVADGVEVVRAMPNTSAQVGDSATAFCLGAGAGEAARRASRTVLGAVGQVVEVPEALMDAVTGLSGSGPAYVYLMVEALVAAGQEVGLSPEVARTLVVQTVKGAARMLAETGEDPAVLRQKVTSPGGTTAAGLAQLQAAGFEEALVRAVVAATQRSRELGERLTAGTGAEKA